MRIFIFYMLIAIAPILLLKIYIQISGNIEARWLLVKYGFIFIIWTVMFIVVAIYKGISSKKNRG